MNSYSRWIQNFSRKAHFLVTGCVLFTAAGILNNQYDRPVLELSKQDTAINIQKDLLILMSAGNKRLITDLLWIQTLIESDLEHYKAKDTNNWMFLRFNTISILDPKFYENYLYGGLFLSIVKDDLVGADLHLDKGLRYYPDDYSLNYHAGFLNYYEIGDYEDGLKYLEKIVDHPRAPVFFRSIVNKLKLENGLDIREVYALVEYNYQSTPEGALKRRLEKDLYALKAEIDLECLNKNESNCARVDLYGDTYEKQDGKFASRVKFLPYRLNKKREGN